MYCIISEMSLEYNPDSIGYHMMSLVNTYFYIFAHVKTKRTKYFN